MRVKENSMSKKKRNPFRYVICPQRHWSEGVREFRFIPMITDSWEKYKEKADKREVVIVDTETAKCYFDGNWMDCDLDTYETGVCYTR